VAKGKGYERYGHFDDVAREFVLTNPFPPTAWINYLGNGRLFAILSSAGGGTTWFREASYGRLTRYRQSQAAPIDRPGPYLYVREKSGALWSPTYEPVRTKLSGWRCRMGMGYVTFEGAYRGLAFELRYFIAPDDDVLLWDLRLKNGRKRPAELLVAPYVEWSFQEAIEEPRSFHWVRYELSYTYDPKVGAVKYYYGAQMARRRTSAFLSASRTPDDRDAFLGRRGFEGAPQALQAGRLTNSQLGGGGHGIGALGFDLRIESGRSKRLCVVLGGTDSMTGDFSASDKLVRTYRRLSNVDAQWEKLSAFYDEYLGGYQAKLPDADMERFVNIWHPHTCRLILHRVTFVSRVHTGMEGGGLRTRDSMQDAQALAHLNPPVVRPAICTTLSYGRSNGWYPNAFNPNVREDLKPIPKDRCDNAVWPIWATYAYLGETGELDLLDEAVPYADGPEATVLEHLWQGLKRISRNLGRRGLPLLFGRDWNDHLWAFHEEGAESVMLAEQTVLACKLLGEIGQAVGRSDVVRWCRRWGRHFTEAINSDAVWDGAWYRRLLFGDDKTPLGSAARPEAKLYANAQSWAVISGAAPPGRAEMALNAVREHLAEPYGIRMLWPPYTGIPLPPAPRTSNAPGVGENGGIFNQPNAWAIWAEAELGRGDQAFEYYRNSLPPVACETVGIELYLSEPYVFCSHIIAPPDARAGRANLSWLTGTAACMYLAATQYILGLRPTLSGLRIRPCVPAAWTGYRVRRRWRGAVHEIEVRNPDGRQCGLRELRVGGKEVDGDVVPPPAGKRRVKVVATM